MWNIGFISEDDFRVHAIPMALYLLGFNEYLGFVGARGTGKAQ